MNRLLGLLIALALGFWAQRTLTGPEPGLLRDAQILFVLAAIVFVWNAAPPRLLRDPERFIRRPWLRAGWLLSLAGLAAGVASLILLWLDLGSAPGLLLWPLATALFLVGTFWERESANGEAANDGPVDRRSPLSAPRSTLAAHWDVILLLAILAAAVFVRFNQIDVYPNGCQSDECNNGLDALKWLSGAPYTPYAETNEGQATFFTYLIALSFKLFGVGVTQMRIVSALVGVITILAFYWLSRDLYGQRAALAAAALLATSRWHVTFSRIVYELIMQPLFMILLAGFLLRALRGGRRRDWALAGLSLAVGLNTYTAFRVVPILLALFLALWIVRSLLAGRFSRPKSKSAASEQSGRLSTKVSKPTALLRGDLRHDLEGMAILAGGAFTAVLPLGVYIVQNWDVFTGRMRHISIMNDVERLGSIQPILDNLRKTVYMFNWQGDNAALNNLPGAAMLDTLAGVLFVLGLAYSLWHAMRRAEPLSVLYLLWFGAILSLGVLSVAHEAPTARRTIGMIPLIYLLAALYFDQLFLAWRRAWRGLGQAAFDGVLAAAVIAVAFLNARAYFQVQAVHPDVWNAYSPAESAVGRFLTTLSPDDTVLITPQYEHHSAIKLIGRGQPYRALNPVEDLPYRGSTVGDLIYVLEPVDKPLLALLDQVYPGGRTIEHRDRYGRSHYIAYRVPGEELAGTQGLAGEFYSSYPPTQAPDAVQPAHELAFDLAQAPLEPPFFALWEGTLLVPDYGQYSFDLLAEGEVATLQIGREHRLELPQGGGQESLTATLAAGFHPIRLEVRSGQEPGQLRLLWTGPGFASQVLGDDNLYAFTLGGQGLVGYYYPNGDWQGPPALVRNDLLIVPNNPLREPFSILWRGKIAIPQDGAYTFGTRSDDGSFLFIAGQLVVDNGGSHGAEDRQGVIQLSQGFHDIEVRYNELGGSREMQLWWQPPGQGRAIVDSNYLFPLEGAAIPEGLALPPPPQIAQPEPEPPVDDIAPPRDRPQPVAPGAAPAARELGDLPVLAAEIAWQFGSCGVGEEQFNQPRGVAVDRNSGDVYVADAAAARIVRLDREGRLVQAWGQAGEAPDQFQEPFDLVVEPQGTVLVLDAVAQRLVRFTPDGQFLASFGENLTFYRPRGLGVNAAGELVVADTGGVRIVFLSPDGVYMGQEGGRETELASKQPTDALSTPGGDLYFVEAESGVVTLLGASGGFNRWQGPRPASTIDGPHLALRPAGGLYVSDPEGQRILLFGPTGQPLGQFGGEAGPIKPVGIDAVAGEGGDLVVVVDSQGCRVLALRVAAP